MFKSINQYIVKEFLKNLLTVTTVMFFLVLFITFLDEFAFFKAKQDLKFIYFLLFTLLKIPNALLNLFPFIILFSGIVFYLKVYNYNEIISLRVMGYSNIQIMLIPALTSLVIGYLIIFLIVPFTSSLLRYYEEHKANYSPIKSSVFIASAIALIARPDLFGEFIGIVGEDAFWTLRMTGIVLIPLGYLMIVVRSVASDSVVKSYTFLMSLVSLSLGIVTLLAPGDANIGRIIYAIIGFLFSTLYVVALALGRNKA